MIEERMIESHRTALLRIVAGLVAMAGVATERLPLPLYRAVLRVLRPAESAVRRLIIYAAQDVVVTLPATRAKSTKRALPTGQRRERASQFQLFDTRKRFAALVKKLRAAPRVWSLGYDPRAPMFRSEPQPRSKPKPIKDGAISAARLFRRLAAIQAALEDIPKQAKRLALWEARRRLKVGAKFTSPMRPGRPPGFRKKPVHDVDHILNECHFLAYGITRGDTS